MTLCPVAIAIGCSKCPAFSVCPLKGLIGDYKEEKKDQNPGGKNTGIPDAGEKK